MTGPGNRDADPDAGSAAYARAAHVRRAPAQPGWEHRQPVMLLHGLGGSGDQLWAATQGTGPTRLAPDARGHGLTPVLGPDARFTFDGLAEDHLALLDRLNCPKALLVGVSMGAGVAVAMARRAPERVTGLLLIRPAWLDEPSPANLAALVSVGDLLGAVRPGEIDAARDRFARSEQCRAIDRVSTLAARSLLAQFDQPQAVARSVRLRRMPASTPFPDIEELGALRSPSRPVVVVGAQDDPTHPLDFARRWARSAGGAELVVLPSRDRSPVEYDRLLARTAQRFVAVDGERGDAR